MPVKAAQNDVQAAGGGDFDAIPFAPVDWRV